MRKGARVAIVALVVPWVGGVSWATQRPHVNTQSRFEITLPAGAKPDLVMALAVCGEAFVMMTTPRTAEILIAHRQTEKTDVIHIRQSQPATQEPYAMAVDCKGDTVYVIDRLAGVSAISMTTGRLVRTYPMPAAFVPSIGAVAQMAEDRNTLVVAGYWLSKAPEAFFAEPVRDAFVGLDLGVRLSLATGATKPMFPAAGTECLASHGICGRMPVDRDGEGWLLGNGSTPSVRFVMGAKGTAGAIRLDSPRLLQSKAPAASMQNREETARWERTFSSVHEVFSFGNAVAVAHSRVRSDARAGIAQFDAFLNIAKRDGTSLRADVPLGDLAVGRDATGVYAIDYGPGGRRTDAGSFALVRYDVPELIKGDAVSVR
jgi:hypothetical protein